LARPVELNFDFPAHFEVTVLERIDRMPEVQRVLSFPDAVRVDSQRELSAGVILAVRAAEAKPWIGIFESYAYGSPPAAPRQVFGWPDGRSLCFVGGGGGCVVRTDEPTQTFEIDCFPICDVLVVPDRQLVVFADFTALIAYGGHGVVWRSKRLALDELTILSAEDDTLHVSGFFGGSRHDSFDVDLRTGEQTGAPREFDYY